MRDVKALHPDLQKKIGELQELCKNNGITIGIGECVRTVSEQDALYAQGRTKPGIVVTKCQGKTYSSMHQWGIAADFYLNMDVDGDGDKKDDAFNNATKLFNRVGKLGQSIGMEWGGSWKGPVDMPHFQLPDWGSTASKLKSLYKTPDEFLKTWKTAGTASDKVIPVTTSTDNPTKTKDVTELAKSRDGKLSGSYKTTANLNLRAGAGKSKKILLTVPKGSIVFCYGYYTESGGVKWYFVQYGKYAGYMSDEYLKKV